MTRAYWRSRSIRRDEATVRAVRGGVSFRRESALRLDAWSIAFVLKSTVLVARLFLASLVAHNTLIRARPLSRLRHALLSAMLSALILLAFEIILFRHFLSSGRDLNSHWAAMFRSSIAVGVHSYFREVAALASDVGKIGGTDLITWKTGVIACLTSKLSQPSGRLLH
jgi:hypothetical protein